MQVSNQAAFNTFKRPPLLFGLATKSQSAPSGLPDDPSTLGDRYIPTEAKITAEAPIDAEILKTPALTELGDNFSKLRIYAPLKALYQFASTKTPFNPIITTDHMYMQGPYRENVPFRVNFYTPYGVGLTGQKVFQPIASVVMAPKQEIVPRGYRGSLPWYPVRLEFDIPTYKFVGGGRGNEKTMVSIDPTVSRLYLAALCGVKVDSLDELEASIKTAAKQATKEPTEDYAVHAHDQEDPPIRFHCDPALGKARITEYSAGHSMIQVPQTDWSRPVPIDREILSSKALKRFLVFAEYGMKRSKIGGNSIDPLLIDIDRKGGLLKFYTEYGYQAESDSPIAAVRIKKNLLGCWKPAKLEFELPDGKRIDPLIARLYLASLCCIPPSNENNQLLPDSHQNLEAVQWDPLPPPKNPRALARWKPPEHYVPQTVTVDERNRKHKKQG